MKYDVRFSCGHESKIELFGKTTDRERKISYFEKYGLCPCCYKEQMEKEKSEGCKEVEMHYSEYKKNYSECKTKAGSYDKVKKTIVVYVPQKGI